MVRKQYNLFKANNIEKVLKFVKQYFFQKRKLHKSIECELILLPTPVQILSSYDTKTVYFSSYMFRSIAYPLSEHLSLYFLMFSTLPFLLFYLQNVERSKIFLLCSKRSSPDISRLFLPRMLENKNRIRTFRFLNVLLY